MDIEALEELHETLKNSSPQEIVQLANSTPLPSIFDSLNDENLTTEQIGTACDILTICLDKLSLTDITTNHIERLENALRHPSHVVRKMALQQIQKDPTSTEVSKRNTIVQAIIICLQNDDLEIAQIAKAILIQMGCAQNGIRNLMSEQYETFFRDVMTSSSTNCVRIYEMLVEIAGKSESNCKNIQGLNLFNEMLSNLDHNDILVRLNVIQLLSKLATTKYGYNYLENAGILQNLALKLDDKDALFAELCEPDILRFFGKIAHWQPSLICAKYPNVIQHVFTNLSLENFTIIGVSLETLGYIGCTNDGKIALASYGASMQNAIRDISSSIGSWTTELKLRSFNCLANLFKYEKENNQITQITQNWFQALDRTKPIDFLYGYARSPFFDIRSTCFSVLAAIAQYHWGQEAIRDAPGMMEFLLNRDCEASKECKEGKFAIVAALVDSPVFNVDLGRKISQYFSEGPFYVNLESTSEVASEGQ